ncbi:NUDIX hydrolase [Amorphus orientalis]|uniref:NrtR DNA-binding winged helix domain-containing protein n=1 Tax=Amorphus orientalis TaxID=649198 RepID=A0AAE4ARQ4_9HYPH|nr:hypothetical protein [Amorphus orientalis]MDQ0314115.1 hypothetical protein [Amorphus orientalis]
MADIDQESRVRVDLTAVVISVHERSPLVLTVEQAPAPALPSGPLRSEHRTLQAGLRSWVEKQTGYRLGYVEQLYTFGDRTAAGPEASEHFAHRRVSIAYLALVQSPGKRAPIQGQWRPWYDFLPWEDRRDGDPHALDTVMAELEGWRRAAPDPSRAERIRLAFASEGGAWDEERALERYELLYEAGLVREAAADRGTGEPDMPAGLPGIAMTSDHRRIVATAVSRLRAKIKYRPVLFELMPPSFTLSELQQTAEALSGVPLHKQNFRRLVAGQGLVEETGEIAERTGGRPARLVRFRKDVMLERPAPGVRVTASRRASYP